jgi:hypothetical protein
MARTTERFPFTHWRIRPWWIVLSFASGFLFAMWAQELAAHWRNDEIHISAPNLHFITGPSLDRLKNGAAVPFDFQLTASLESRGGPIARALERFVVSYDLWEEKYSVSKVRASTPVRDAASVSHLSVQAAEAWCVGQIALPTSSLRNDQPFWLRLELRSIEPKQSAGVVGDSGISLTRLIDVFSHPLRPEQQRWAIESGPFKLDDLKRASRGS